MCIGPVLNEYYGIMWPRLRIENSCWLPVSCRHFFYYYYCFVHFTPIYLFLFAPQAETVSERVNWIEPIKHVYMSRKMKRKLRTPNTLFLTYHCRVYAYFQQHTKKYRSQRMNEQLCSWFGFIFGLILFCFIRGCCCVCVLIFFSVYFISNPFWEKRILTVIEFGDSWFDLTICIYLFLRSLLLWFARFTHNLIV